MPHGYTRRMPPKSRKQQKFLAAKKPKLFSRWRRQGKARVKKK